MCNSVDLIIAKDHLLQEVKHRPSWDEYFMRQAVLISERSTCTRLQVGVVLVSTENKLLSSGYNGVPKGMMHCKEYFYEYFTKEVIDAQYKTTLTEKEKLYDLCSTHTLIANIRERYFNWLNSEDFRKIHREFSMRNEIHAEQNALAGVSIEQMRGGKMYSTLSPCENCAKMVVASGIKTFYYLDVYDRDIDNNAFKFLSKNNIELINVKL